MQKYRLNPNYQDIFFEIFEFSTNIFYLIRKAIVRWHLRFSFFLINFAPFLTCNRRHPYKMKITVKSVLLICSFLAIYATTSMAQDTIPSLSAKPENPDNFWRRVSIGGNLGFQFGSVTGITVAPEVAIRTVDNLYVGLRFMYQYYNYKNYFWNDTTNQYMSYKSSVYGGGIFLRYYLNSLFDNFLGNLFAHVEYEYQYYTRPYTSTANGTGYIIDPYGISYIPGKQVVEVNSFFVGGGYRQPIASRVSMDFLILFNLNDSYNSPYSNPIFRLGVGVGL